MSAFIASLAEEFDLSAESQALAQEAIEACRPHWQVIDDVLAANQIRVLAAFQKNHVGDFHLNGSTGYGYGDSGREVLEELWADLFKAEKALARSNLVSGTHAIATVLLGLLRPGDHFVAASGPPYDTMLQVIGKDAKEPGTLAEIGVRYDAVDLVDGDFDIERLKQVIRPETRLVLIQRSRGYEWRKSLSIAKIKEACALIHGISPDIMVFVDNCYGEFVEEMEPLEVGADLIAGSLIKNPGGGLAPRGGYIAGKADLVDRCAVRLTAPGIADDVTSALDFNRPAFQGLFMAPLIVAQALKGAVFAAYVLARKGYVVSPAYDEPRTDIIQAIAFGDPDRLRTFGAGIQGASPLEAYVTPVDSEVPGYDDPILMAGGTFIQGSSIELSLDGPIRPPYIGYMQGGLSLAHVMCAVLSACEKLEG